MSASHPSEAATRVTVGDHTFFPDNAARDLEAMAYEYETNLRFKLDSTSAGLFLRNVAHGLRMCARTFDLAARSPAPSNEPAKPDVRNPTCECGHPFSEHYARAFFDRCASSNHCDCSAFRAARSPEATISTAPDAKIGGNMTVADVEEVERAAREVEPACATCGHPPHGKCCDACNGSGFTGTNQRCQWCNPAPPAPSDALVSAQRELAALRLAVAKALGRVPEWAPRHVADQALGVEPHACTDSGEALANLRIAARLRAERTPEGFLNFIVEIPAAPSVEARDADRESIAQTLWIGFGLHVEKLGFHNDPKSALRAASLIAQYASLLPPEKT